MKKIAFIYIAEPYQCYHAASVAIFLKKYINCEVTEYYSFTDSKIHLFNINSLYNSYISIKPFKKSVFSRFLHMIRFLDTEKNYVLKENIHDLNKYDAIIATENTAAFLKQQDGFKPKLILIQHGAGDRKVSDEYLAKYFDLVLFPGPKMRDYFIKSGFSTLEKSKIIGYPKFDILSKSKENNFYIFNNENQIVLYNPHYKKSQTSYYSWNKYLISSFKKQDIYNLIVAPHVKMFHEKYFINKFLLKSRGDKNVFIDTGSIKTLDMTYTSNASIYIGDVSSQIYEFIIKPRPCVFLNPHKISWRGNPYFKNWEFGEVVESEEEIMPAVYRAQEKHEQYIDIQKEMFQKTFDNYTLTGASQRAARAIMDYLELCAPEDEILHYGVSSVKR